MSQGGRTHIVLVPGFFGFDMLGQVAYYAGQTRIFEDWRRDCNIELHSFDTFPTASIAIRARRLKEFLATGIACGDFGDHDCLALVGHSTGALDIRKLLFDLGKEPHGTVHLDVAASVSHEKILDRIGHLVFLSAPHYGTNLADLGCRLAEAWKGVVNNAAWGVTLNRTPVTNVRRFVCSLLPGARSDLLLALEDALNESDELVGGPTMRADSREARADWALWLEHMGKDFQIVRDLQSHASASRPSGGGPAAASPAHFSAEQRAFELDLWRARGISTRSYATMLPGRFVDHDATILRLIAIVKAIAPVLEAGATLLNWGAALWALPISPLVCVPTRAVVPTPSLLGLIGLVNHDPGLVVNVFHALCADPSGGFRTPPGIPPTLHRFGDTTAITSKTIAVGDSDGVVNTQSMLWPYEPTRPDAHPTYLVESDHADIIGHYHLVPLAGALPKGRRYEAYDFFQTRLAFQQNTFERVWEDIFDSCVRAS